MLKETVKYLDFNGEKQVEELYFNLTEAEIIRLDLEYPGGLKEYTENLNAETEPQDIMDLFEKILYMSYGEKSEDGKRFIKSETKSEEFKQSAVYSALFVSLMQDGDKAVEFFNSMLSVTAPSVKVAAISA